MSVYIFRVQRYAESAKNSKREKDNVLYPVEIKKSAHPTLDMTKTFSVLEKISGKEVGQGAIICQCEKNFP